MKSIVGDALTSKQQLYWEYVFKGSDFVLDAKSNGEELTSNQKIAVLELFKQHLENKPMEQNKYNAIMQYLASINIGQESFKLNRSYTEWQVKLCAPKNKDDSTDLSANDTASNEESLSNWESNSSAASSAASSAWGQC